MRRLGEGGVRCLLVAERPLEHRVVGRSRHGRGSGRRPPGRHRPLRRARHRRHRRARRPIWPARLRFGHHHRHMVADIAHLAAGPGSDAARPSSANRPSNGSSSRRSARRSCRPPHPRRCSTAEHAPVPPGRRSCRSHLMRAWACGLAHEIGVGLARRLISSTYRPLPVMNRWSSLRITRAPIPVSFMISLLAPAARLRYMREAPA